jgi:hypothetical protein
MNDEYNILYKRAREVQPHIKKLVSNFEKDGLSSDDILIEICFSLIHDGYRLRELKDGVKIKANERKLQTHIPE